MKCLVIANNKNCIYTRLHYCPNICRIIFLAFFLKRFFYCGFISVAYQQINLILEHNWNSFHHSISNFLNKVAQDLLTFPVFIAFRHFVSFYDGKKKKVHLKFLWSVGAIVSFIFSPWPSTQMRLYIERKIFDHS